MELTKLTKDLALIKPRLKPNEYALIVPQEQKYLMQLIQISSSLTPQNLLLPPPLHTILSNEKAVTKALESIPETANFHIIVIDKKENRNNTLIYSTLNEYCEENKIKL